MDARIERTRETVLAAARDLLLDEGLTAITPTRVAERSGIARRTIYRHWPTTDELMHDALAGASYPTYPLTGDLDADLRAHLVQLRDALEHGPLAYILLALGERAAVDGSMARLRDRLVSSGCAPLRTLLAHHGAPDDLLDDLVDEIEGPVLSSALVHGRPASEGLITAVVETVARRAWRVDASAVP